MPFLLLALIVVPIVELYVIVQVGQAIGVLWTVALLLADSVLGAWLMRSQGRTVWRRFVEALNAGRVPAREVVDGGLVIFGGAFLMTPGFVTDVFGVALLAPPSRALLRTVLLRRFVAIGATMGTRGFASRRRRAGVADYDVEGTAHEATAPALDSRENPPHADHR